MAENRNPTRALVGTLYVALFVGLLVAAWRAPEGNWDLALFGVLLAFSVFSDLTAAPVESQLVVSGSFLALVVAMVFLGGTPAALIGVLTILVGWIRWRSAWIDFLDNI